MGKPKVGVCVVGSIGTNCYILTNEDTGEVVIVDPGDEAETILAHAVGHGEKLAAILLTHGHFDHILAVNEIKAKCPDAVVYAAEAERDLLADPHLNQGYYDTRACVSADIWVKEGDVIRAGGLSFSVIETPGHTRGSICFYMEAEKLLFAGDTLFYRSWGRTDLPTGSEDDMEFSLARLCTTLPEDVTVLTGHGEMTTIGFEKKVKGFT